jgi:hypothetical protein
LVALIAFLRHAARREFDLTDVGSYFLAPLIQVMCAATPVRYASIFSKFGIYAIGTMRFLGVAMTADVGRFAGWEISVIHS